MNKHDSIRSDVWTHDTCVVCQTKHSTIDEKLQHEQDIGHAKKVVVYDFLSKELSCLVPCSTKSMLFERYNRAGALIAGLECICELSFSWTTSSFWACTICYVAGKNLDSADAHLYSTSHRRNYLSEYHPEKFANIVLAQEKSDASKHSVLEYETIMQIYLDSEQQSPDVYEIAERSKEWAFKKLGLGDEDSTLPYILEPVSDEHQIVLCQLCGESFLTFEGDVELQKSWTIHLSNQKHQRSQLLDVIISELPITNTEDFSSEIMVHNEKAWSVEAGIHYGPTMGIEYMVKFTSNEYFCGLCFCIVSKEECSRHARNLTHIENVLRRTNPSRLLNIEHGTMENRQTVLSELIEDDLSNNYLRRTNVMAPILLKNFANPENRTPGTINIKEVDFKAYQAYWCPTCNKFIKKSGSSTYEDHMYGDDHFTCLVRRDNLYFDKEFFVNKWYRLPTAPRKDSNKWEEKQVGKETVPVQNYEFGVEWLVFDEMKKTFVCQCCCVAFAENEAESTVFHLRSFQHIKRVLDLSESNVSSVVNKSEDIYEQKNIILDYLQCCKFLPSAVQVHVYDPILAFSLNCRSMIPKKLINLTSTVSNKRNTTSDKSDDDGFVGLNVALSCTSLEIVNLSKDELLLWCQTFSVAMEKLERIWTGHLFTSTHLTRQATLKINRLSESYRLPAPSPLTVWPFTQKSDRKMTWKWDSDRKCYQFVYTRVGIKDISQRNHFVQDSVDFFCNLCARTIKFSQDDLEAHARSFEHVYHYVHKYHQSSIPELEAILLDQTTTTIPKRKAVRKFFTKLLKGSEAQDLSIPVYDFSSDKRSKSKEIAEALDMDELHTAGTDENDVKQILGCGGSSLMLQCLSLIHDREQKKSEVKKECEEKPLILEAEAKKVLDEKTYSEMSEIKVESEKKQENTKESPKKSLDAAKKSPVKKASEKPKEKLSSKVVAVKNRIKPSGLVRRPISSPRSRREPVMPKKVSRLPSPPKYEPARVQKEVLPKRAVDLHAPREADRNIPSHKPRSPERRLGRSPPRQRSIPRMDFHRRSPPRIEARDDRRVLDRRDRPVSRPRSLERERGRALQSPERDHGRLPPRDKRISAGQKRRSPANVDLSPDRRMAASYRDAEREQIQIFDRSGKNVTDSRLLMPLDRHRSPPRDLRARTPPRDMRARSPPRKARQRSPPRDARLNTWTTDDKRRFDEPPMERSSEREKIPLDARRENMPNNFVPPPPAHLKMPAFPEPPVGGLKPFIDMPPLKPFGMAPPGMPMFPLPPTWRSSPEKDMGSAYDPLRGRMEFYRGDLKNIRTLNQLVEYIVTQGYDKIPADDPPLLFNNIVTKKPGILGISSLYQVITYEHPELECYYCEMCNHFTTVSEMFLHLNASMHRLTYMKENYKMYYQKAMNEFDENVRDTLLGKYATQIWHLEGSGEVVKRMRCILNEEVIRRVWPDYKNYIDNSWKLDDGDLGFDTRTREVPPQLPPPRMDAMPRMNEEESRRREFSDKFERMPAPPPKRQAPDDRAEKDIKRKRDAETSSSKLSEHQESQRKYVRLTSKEDEKKYQSRRSKSPSRHSKSLLRRRTPPRRSKSPDRRRSPLRRRSRSPIRKEERLTRDAKAKSPAKTRDEKARSPNRASTSSSSQKKKQGSNSWEEKAAHFLRKIGDEQAAFKLIKAAHKEKSPLNDRVVTTPPPMEPVPTFEQRLRDAVGSRTTSTVDQEDAFSTFFSKKTSPEKWAPEPEKVAKKPPPRQQPEEQSKVELRRMLGVIVTMQELQKLGQASSSMFYKVCDEMGISRDEIERNDVLKELHSLIAKNVPEFQKTDSMGSMLSSLSHGAGSQTTNLLSNYDYGHSSTKSQARGPMHSMQQPQEEVVSFVYPGHDDNRSMHRSEQDVDSSIERLTYAFGQSKGAEASANVPKPSAFQGYGGTYGGSRFPGTTSYQPTVYSHPSYGASNNTGYNFPSSSIFGSTAPAMPPRPYVLPGIPPRATAPSNPSSILGTQADVNQLWNIINQAIGKK